MDIMIRQAVSQDFDEVFPLFKQLWPTKSIDHDELKATFDRGVDSSHDVLLCAVCNARVIGFCAYAIVNNLWQEGRIAYLYAMVVEEEYRGAGVGTALIKEVVHRSRTNGLKRVELDSGFPREQAHKFYEQLGFKKRAYLFSYDPCQP